MKGAPLQDVVGPLAANPPEFAFLFIVDGCRADTLYNAIDNGWMPYLKELMEEMGYRRYEKCITVFPSVTIACHASLVTGTYPGWHGIVGNNWFIRKKWARDGHHRKFYEATREYVKMSWWHPGSDPGLVNGFCAGTFFSIANSDLYERASTIFEAHDAEADGTKSASVFEMVWRGADRRRFIGPEDTGALLGGLLYDMLNWIYSKLHGIPILSFMKKVLDRRSFEETRELLDRPNRRPTLFVVWVPGMDAFSHKNGSTNQPEYFRRRSNWVRGLLGSMDKEFKRLHRMLKKKGFLDKTTIAVTADHGQYPADVEYTISMEEIYKHLRNDPNVSPGETFPLTADGHIDDNCTDATVAISQNGGSCHVYVKADTGWGAAPSPDRLRKFAKSLSALPCSDQVLVRDGTDGCKVWKNDDYQNLSVLDPDEYPLAEERVNSLAATLRAGDIILSARSPYYYEGKPMKGEHGSLHREDSHVPLIFMGKGLGNQTDPSTVARVIDVAPTIAEAMGFLDALRREGTKKDKLGHILDALEDLRTSDTYRAGADETLSRVSENISMDRARGQWDLEERDMRENFEAKTAAYLADNTISQPEHDAFMSRYNSIIT